jgi:predicted Zn-dependent peptidase
MSSIRSHRYPNGLVLLVEPIADMASVGMTLLLPAGVAYEPADKLGVSTVLADMIFRGAGAFDSRQHSDALDQLGVHRTGEAQTHHLRIGATMIGDRLPASLPLLLDAARRPRLPEDGFEPAVQLALQSIDSLEDDPQHKVMVELKKLHQPQPIGRSTYGDPEHLEAMSLADVRRFWKSSFVPQGAILALAGNVKFDEARDLVGVLTADWTGSADLNYTPTIAPRGNHHHLAETAQQHIGVAYDTVGEADERANVLQRVATAVLSGGMSGRLFTEVREVRGLVYSVYAAYYSQRERGTIYSYASTTPQRAAETLDVLVGELRKLTEGVKADEFERALVGMKSRLVMQGESTSARAATIAMDQFLLGRPRTLEEMRRLIDAVTLADLNAFVAAHPPQDLTTLTIGPATLSVA